MAFTYTVTTDRGKVRLLLRDTVSATAEFADDEIDALLTLASNDIFMASSHGCRSLAAKYAAKATSKKTGNYSEDLTKRAKQYMDLAKTYEEASTNQPWEETVALGQDVVAYAEFVWNEALRGNA